jgi:VWFA-related protein
MLYTNTFNKSLLTLGLMLTILFGTFFPPTTSATETGKIKTITVTVEQKRSAEKIDKIHWKDFVVQENGVTQTVVGGIPAHSNLVPLNLAIVIQEGSNVNNQLNSLRTFIHQLPQDSKVMLVYLQRNFVNVVQEFTLDKDLAASKLRVVNENPIFSGTLSVTLVDVMKKFNLMPVGRNEILFISNGQALESDFTLGLGSTPLLDRVIKVAQQENITIFTLYSPVVAIRGLAGLQVQRNLSLLASATGGHAFLNSSTFVSFDAPLQELNEKLQNQYVVSYRSTLDKKGFRELKVKTDYSAVKVTAASGYKADF